MIIELLKESIFFDLGSYLFAREFVQSKGYRVSLDGLIFESMQIIDHPRVGADMIKMIWNSEIINGGENVAAQVWKLTDDLGDKRVVLCPHDNREAIDLAIYQGSYVENLIVEDAAAETC
jgi:hypothetical protein